jgi:hypothetical protein
MSLVFSKIVFRRKDLDFLLNDPFGPVGRHLFVKGRAIVAAAKAQVGVDTGRLKNSIHMRQTFCLPIFKIEDPFQLISIQK